MAEKIMVLELAKELGLPPLDLVGKIKALEIDVKSHMSLLSLDQVDKIREALMNTKGAAEVTDKGAAKKSKTTTRKRVVKKAAKKTTTKKATAAEEELTPEEAEAAAAAKKAKAKTKTKKIIRRRVKKEGEEETQTETTKILVKGEDGKKSVESTEIERTVEVKGDSDAPGEVTSVRTTKTVTTTDEMGETVESKETFEGAPTPVAPATEEEKPENLHKAPDNYTGPVDQYGRPIAAGFMLKTDKAKKLVNARDAAPPPSELSFRAKKVDYADFETKSGANKLTRGYLKEEMRTESELKMYDFKRAEIVFTPKKKKVLSTANVKKTLITKAKASKRVIRVNDTIPLSELAQKLGERLPVLMKKLMDMGVTATANQLIDFDTASLLATDYDYELQNVGFKEEELIQTTSEDKYQELPRRPIVTVMGHVDHGKTSLLDAIRSTDVVAGEAGGITQHIGAYLVNLPSGQSLAFLDTPGHEAFAEMRARGANLTDIAVLVVAADDGIMPQTRESIDHAKAAGVPIVVAINKCDRPEAKPEQVKQALSEYELIPEEWGGETLFFEVSAIQKTNIDKLLEGILLQSEVLELHARQEGPAEGRVIEAKMEKGMGPVATVMVERGTLRKGDALVCGLSAGRVRMLNDYNGKPLKEAGPATPVQVIGLDFVPAAGDEVLVAENDKAARVVVEKRREALKAQETGEKARVSLEDLLSAPSVGEEAKQLNLIIKSDVDGSLEAIKTALNKLSNDQVKVHFVSARAGGISESDILLASTSQAIIIGFNVSTEGKARTLAEKEGVQIKTYRIIYELIDEVKSAMEGLLEPDRVEKFLGRAEVRELFSIPKIGVIAGSSVIDGKIIRNSSVRLLRDSKVVYEGKLSSLRRFKDDAKEVTTGYECGIGLENFNDIKPGDVIEAFKIEEIRATLNS